MDSKNNQTDKIINLLLENRLGLSDFCALDRAERLIASLKKNQLLLFPLPDKLNFSFLKKLHKFLFSEVYP